MYAIGETRTLGTKYISGELHVIRSDFVGGQSAQLSPACWSAFRAEIENIEEAVKQMCERQYVKYFHHLGEDWYVSVTTGFRCVDFRRFYKCAGDKLLPRRQGIALRLDEWATLVRTIPVLDSDFGAYGENEDANQLLKLAE